MGKKSKLKKAEKVIEKAIVPAVLAASKSKPKKRKNRVTAAKASLLANPAGSIAGKGSYFGDFMSGVANVGKEALGMAIKKGVSGLLSGFGDYRERSSKANYKPMSVGDVQGASPATFVGAAAPRIRHREYIGNIYSTINFNTTVYPIQIGVPDLFPWLSTLADSFQQYRIHGMELYYESTSSNVSATTNTALGTVMMSTLYEVQKAPLSSSVQVLNNEFTTSEKPTECFYHPIECDPKSTTVNVLYTRTQFQEQSSFTDLGNFQVSTEGMQADGVQIGKLWCTYDVEVIKPTLPDSRGSYIRWQGLCQPGTSSAGGTAPNIGAWLLDNQIQSTTFVTRPTLTTITSTADPNRTVQQINMPKNNFGQYLLGWSLDSLTVNGGGTIAFSETPVVRYTNCAAGDALWFDYWPQGFGLSTYQQMGGSQHDFGGAIGNIDVGFRQWQTVNFTDNDCVVELDFPINWTQTQPAITIILIQIPPFHFGLEKQIKTNFVDEMNEMRKQFAKLQQLVNSNVIVDDDEKKVVVQVTPKVSSTKK